MWLNDVGERVRMEGDCRFMRERPVVIQAGAQVTFKYASAIMERVLETNRFFACYFATNLGESQSETH